MSARHRTTRIPAQFRRLFANKRTNLQCVIHSLTQISLSEEKKKKKSYERKQRRKEEKTANKRRDITIFSSHAGFNIIRCSKNKNIADELLVALFQRVLLLPPNMDLADIEGSNRKKKRKEL